MTSDLQGTRIVVTRPARQAESLCSLIEKAGGTPIRCPVIEIADVQESTELDKVLSRLAHYQIAIFISPNAVRHGVPLIESMSGFPDTLVIAAVGQGTAMALELAGHPASIVPDQKYNSEALLETDALTRVSGKNIIIFRGTGGREHLAETLRQRGASVDYAECYRRVRPAAGIKRLLPVWEQGHPDIIIVTSSEGLQNLLDMAGESDQADTLIPQLLDTPLLLVSERTATFARQSGFTQTPILADRASDDALLQGLINWRQTSDELR